MTPRSTPSAARPGRDGSLAVAATPAAGATQDVRMDGAQFFRTSAGTSATRMLAPGPYSYCVMLRRGRLRLDVAFPSAASLDLQDGDVVAVSGLAEHGFAPPGAGRRRAGFDLRPMATPERAESDLLIGMVANESLALGSLVIGPILIRPAAQPDLAQQVWRVADMLEAEYRLPAPDSDLVVRRLAEIILINMTRRLRPDDLASSAPPGAERQIMRALDAFFGAPERTWDLRSLAREAAMSRTRFAETFKALTGQTPAHVVSRLRLATVARRLASEDLSIDSAAAQAGYGSTAAFVRAFQRVHGETPGRWRRRQAVGGTLPPPAQIEEQS